MDEVYHTTVLKLYKFQLYQNFKLDDSDYRDVVVDQQYYFVID